MENLFKQITSAMENQKVILVHNLGRRNEKFQLTNLLKEYNEKIFAWSELDLGTHIIESLYEKRNPTENLPVCEIMIFYDCDCFTCKPLQMDWVRKMVDVFVKAGTTCIFTCHANIPEDVNVFFDSIDNVIKINKEE